MSAEQTYKSFDFRDFSLLDDSKDAQYLIDSMDELTSLECIQEMKKRAINLLDVQKGEHVLELGCGLGDDAEGLGKLVGLEGRVDAVDSSYLMITEAKARSKSKNVFYSVGDAAVLDYEKATFNVCHMDRLLVSQRKLDEVFQEALRVLKPGGRLCITDCDFGSIMLYPYVSDITPVLLKRLFSIVENPIVGRSLLALFKRNGLRDIQVIPEPYVLRSFTKLNKMIDFPRILQDLTVEGLLKEAQSQKMLYEFEKADREGTFLYGVTLFTVFGFNP